MLRDDGSIDALEYSLYKMLLKQVQSTATPLSAIIFLNTKPAGIHISIFSTFFVHMYFFAFTNPDITIKYFIQPIKYLSESAFEWSIMLQHSCIIQSVKREYCLVIELEKTVSAWTILISCTSKYFIQCDWVSGWMKMWHWRCTQLRIINVVESPTKRNFLNASTQLIYVHSQYKFYSVFSFYLQVSRIVD